MTTFKHCAALLTAVLAAGCAATDRRAVDDESVTAAPQEALGATHATAVNVAESGEVRTVDAQELALTPEVVCRDVLRPGSNVLVTYCMTPAGWRAYKRRQEQEAREILRALQGSPYR